ncbi:helix-turn-helix domain-containing protein [uncultured Rummeliibacillus sp.]|uniref:helix-turn-helix domain-containing protein n=1 Tax=uncultured Rummeliibacillus sp. TaxID=762292 RepID=UPI0026023D18|nr:helix-turn-helix transcriptional regulator [uncultured Rummeliibacillus sp.]
MATLGERLRKLRKNKTSLSMKEFGKIFGLSESAIGMYERNEREPDLKTINKIADYFDVTVDYLMGRSDIMNPRMFENAGITNEEYTNLTSYQKEVVDFFLTREDLFFHDRPERLLDALEQFEIFYEVWKKQQDKK